MSTDTREALAAERAAFEEFIARDGGDLSTFGSGAHVHYRNSAVNNAWTGWTARAALATPAAPAQAARCDYCAGKGEHWGSDGPVMCGHCGGTGAAPAQPSAQGEAATKEQQA